MLTLCHDVTGKAVMQICMRHKTGSPGQSQKKNRPDRDRRIKFPPGTRVLERDILATQLNLDYHPGLNVSSGNIVANSCLYQCICCLSAVFCLFVVAE